MFERLRDARQVSLARRAGRGDREAFRHLYHALHPVVAGYVARRVPRHEDAEDVVARVFHRLLDAIASYDAAKGTPRMLAVSIARNAVVDKARARKPDAPVEAALAIADPAPSPLERILGREDLAALRTLVERLPDDTRELIALRFGDELSHREIGALTGATEDAVKQRFSRTMRELRLALSARQEALNDV